jgi:penicillin-binding protein 1B
MMDIKTLLNKRTIRWILISCSIVILLTILLIAIYMMSLSKEIDRRFSGRPWDIPSRVYSDTTILYTGQTINFDLFVQKLVRLGYRNSDHAPEKQGEMSVSKNSIAVYLHDFNTPTYQQESKPVMINLRGGQITGIKDLKTNDSISLLELEPEELMLYFGPKWERRQFLSIRTLPPHIVHAILAAEDHDYYKHQGISIRGIVRAVVQNIRTGRISQGASTITQQVARMFFLNQEVTFRRKIKEQMIAVTLEFKFSKADILEIFINETNWGQQGSAAIVGLAEAARFYFDKKASDLSVNEAATLAVIIRNASYYSPYRNPEKLLAMRNMVLTAMHEEEWLDDEGLSEALAKPLGTVEYTTRARHARYFTDYLTGQIAELYPLETLTGEGLSIFTTIDTQVQEAAEEALDRGLAGLEAADKRLRRNDPAESLQGAIVVMQPKTGYILAMAGGRNYGVSQYNRAVEAMRQPGSAFKPFVYVTALDRLTTVSKLSNSPQTYIIDGKPWIPKNFEEDAPSELTLREALAYSQNVATVNMAFSDGFFWSPDVTAINLSFVMGLKRLQDVAKAFHLFSTETPYPSMVLGAQELTPLMLARAYCVFAADGVLPFPLSVSSVVDEAGNVLERRHALIERVISPAKAYLMSDMLRSAVESGTGRSMRSYGVDWPVAGKTGTTNETRDAWFVGYTPNILAVVWVGFDNNDPVHATGARAALPVWADLMKALPQYVSGEWFVEPPGIEKHTVCKSSGLLAGECCPDTLEEIFLSENAPKEICDQHKCPD